MRILVVGGTGLVGSRAAQHLLRCGHHVRVATRNTGSAEIGAQEQATINWNHEESLNLACLGMDAVVHAAGMNAKECALDPVGALSINGLGSAKLALAARRAGVKRFLYFSTAHVYASPLSGVISETSYPTNLHPYASSHLAGEYAVRGIGDVGGMQVLAIRLSNAVGAPVSSGANCWGLLANDLCRQIVEQGSMRLTSDGIQWRDFIPLNAVTHVVEQLLIGTNNLNSVGVLNLGSRSMRVIDFAQLIQKRAAALLGKVPQLHLPSATSPVEAFRLDYRSERMTHLGLSPEIDLEGEIDRLLVFCQVNFRDKGKGQ